MNVSHRNAPTRRRVAIAFAACVISAVVLVALLRERGVADVRLTVPETLFLTEIPAYSVDRGPPYRYYSVANAAANPQVRETFSQGRQRRHQEVAPLILGYTGTEEDAEFLIEWLQKLSRTYQEEPDRFVAEDGRALQSVFEGLGLMGRRRIPAAEQFLTDAVNGRLKVPLRFRWYNDPGDQTLVLSFIGYAFLKPADFHERIDAAIRRAPVEKREALRAQLLPPQGGGLVSILRSVEALESRPITKSDLERFRTNAANWWSKRNRR
jgi:hypothetical protein